VTSRIRGDVVRVDHRRVLDGFHHPAGANGHRAAQYKDKQDLMRKTVRAWFGQGTL
jgi:hypothetical protein